MRKPELFKYLMCGIRPCTRLYVRNCQASLFFWVSDLISPIAVGINKSPSANGKNQKPNPLVTPIEKEKINKIANFKNLYIRVAIAYCFSALSSVIFIK